MIYDEGYNSEDDDDFDDGLDSDDDMFGDDDDMLSFCTDISDDEIEELNNDVCIAFQTYGMMAGAGC